MPMEGFVKHVDDSSASLLLNNPEVAPWERRAGRVGLGFSSDADEVMHTNRARRSRSRSRTRDRGRDHQRVRRSRSRSRDRQRDHRNRRSRSRERHGRRRSRPRSRSRNRRSSRSRSRSGNRRDRDHDRHGQSRVPHDEGRTRDVRDVRPSGSSRHEAPAPVSGAALSIAQKLKARAEANGKERGAGSWATQQATQLALRDTIHRDDNQRGGGWEQFDLNKMNYELETKGAMVSDQRKAVLAAIDGESECIRDEIDEDQYRHSSTGVSSQDDRHMAKIFGHVSTAGSGFGYGQQRKSADSRGADANKECLPDASGLDLDGATVEGFTEDGSAQQSGGGAGVSGWKDRIKRAQMAQKVASDRLTTLRMQRIAAAQKLSDGSRMPSTAGV